ncbi:MAG: nitroreductase [Bacteroidota bacterium]
MDITPSQVSELIRKRRSVFPKSYTGSPISREIVEEVLENANWAPTHKMTEPWRFKVMAGGGLERLSQFLSSYYKENTPPEKFSEIKFKKLKNNPLKASCIIAICMKRDEQERIPEWEELAAVGCAVQNMYLTCAAYDIGCYWSSTKAALQANDFLGLEEGERCLGLFYMSYHNAPDIPRKRTPVAEKTAWITG